MSSSPDAALDTLRGLPNPFDALVRPQRPDDRFADLHVDALLRSPRELLRRIIDSYRLSEYAAGRDLRETRVVTVLGPRGAGKTHMLEALIQRDDSAVQLIVRPGYFAVGVPFEEYVLNQLLNTLLEDDPLRGSRPYDAIAGQLTRRLLRQAVRGLGPTERLFACAPSGWQRLRLLWRGGERFAARFGQLAADLDDPKKGQDVVGVALQRGIDTQFLLKLIAAHIERWERGDGALAAIRRQLYLTMARSVLLRDAAAPALFLEQSYAPAGARPFFRAEVVRQLLHALIEACALVQMPVVFAFDNLEGLVAAQGQLQPEVGRAFLDGLAQAVDGTRGLLFLLFAETTLYRELRKQTDQFALDRLDQGVPLYAQGLVDRVELRPPDFAQLQELIAIRLQRLLRDRHAAAELPQGFPFGNDFLDDLARRSDLGLRNLLLRLRDEYSRVVYGRSVSAPAEPAAPRDWAPLLERAWTDQLRSADHKLQGALISQRQDIHVGLGRLLQQLDPIASDGWLLVAVQPVVSIGSHPGYGVVSLVEWRPEPATGMNGKDEGAKAVQRIGVGLLLAGGAGMPRDLQAKFELFEEGGVQTDGVVVLWPRPALDNLPATLPEATRQVWSAGSKRRQAALRAISDHHLRTLLALPAWLDECLELEVAPPAAVVKAFLVEHCAALVRLALPPAEEGALAHAN